MTTMRSVRVILFQIEPDGPSPANKGLGELFVTADRKPILFYLKNLGWFLVLKVTDEEDKQSVFDAHRLLIHKQPKSG